jgi:hypothetical protein
MIRFIIITFLSLLNFANINELHDAVIAKFHIIQRGEVLFLEVEFDAENMVKLNKTNSLRVTKEDFTKYLNETTSWFFDGKKITPKTLSLQSSRGHNKAICFLSKSLKDVKKVQIKNEFLLDINNHINVVMIDINKSFKDYKLDKNRKELTVHYN